MNRDIGLETKLIPVKDQVSCDLGGETVILNLRNGEYFGLNPVAAKIWEILQEPREVAEVRDLLLEEYSDVEPDRCTEDLLDIVRAFVKADLVEIVDAGAAPADQGNGAGAGLRGSETVSG